MIPLEPCTRGWHNMYERREIFLRNNNSSTSLSLDKTRGCMSWSTPSYLPSTWEDQLIHLLVMFEDKEVDELLLCKTFPVSRVNCVNLVYIVLRMLSFSKSWIFCIRSHQMPHIFQLEELGELL